MSRRLRSRALLISSALAAMLGTSGLLVASHALAQTANTPQAYATAPADHLLVTPNGVDLRSGRYDYKQTDLSIGSDGETGLQLTRLPRGGVWGHLEPFANFTHNLDIMIAEKRVQIGNGNYNHRSGNDYRMIVRFGSRSETFDGFSSGPYFEQISKSGTARLTYTGGAASGSAVYQYQAPDGTIAVFRPIGSGDCSSQLRCAYVSEITFPDATRLFFEYDNSNSGAANAKRLRSVTSSRGYALLLEYGGGWNTVAKACVLNLARRAKPADSICPGDALASSSYTYTASGETLLSSSTDATGRQSSYQYGYTDGHRTIGFVKPGAQAPWLTNSYYQSNGEDTGTAEEGVKDVTVRQVLAEGPSYDVLIWNALAETEYQIIQPAGGRITDAQSNTIEAYYGYPKMPKTMIPGYDPSVPDNLPDDGGASTWTRYQITPGPISIKDQLGRTTTFDYCDPNAAASLPASEHNRCVVTPLRSYTDPEGARTELTYGVCNNVTQTRRRAKPGTSLPDIVVTAGFDCLQPKYATKPVAVTDANGNTTNYTYAPEHGGMLSELQAASSAGAARPLKLYSYAQRYAYVLNAAGVLVPASSPVWVPETETQCQTVAGPNNATLACDVAGDRVATTYEYGANGTADNLLVRGLVVTADGTSRRTCFNYDARGNKISETSPRAGRSTCQ